MQQPLRLGELIAAIKDRFPVDANEIVRFDFCNLVPDGAMYSYRGFYKDLALHAVSRTLHREHLRVQDFLTLLRGVAGQTFTGYKGGNYTMHEGSRVWVSTAQEDCCGTAVIDVDRTSFGACMLITAHVK